MARLQITLFGYPRVVYDGNEVKVDTRKAIALLAYLACSGESPSRDSLAGLLWPDYDQISARGALRRTLSVLNKATGGDILDIERERVGLVASADLFSDVGTYKSLLRSAEQERIAVGGQSTKYLATLAEAVDLYRERFMAGFTLRDSPNFDDWQYLQSEQLAQSLATALEQLARSFSAAGDANAALATANRWLMLDPLIEEAHRLVMQLHAQAGQRSAALRQYRECVRILDQELGVTPLAETDELYHAILNNRYSPPATISIQAETKHPEQDESAAAVQVYPLVGRAREMTALKNIYDQAREIGQFVILEGEAGIGKTRLAEAFVESVTRQGAALLTLRCYEGESGLAYAPFISGLTTAQGQPDFTKRISQVNPTALVDAARLAPDLASRTHSQSGSPDAPASAARFLESVRQVIMRLVEGGLPGVIYLDDIQWADAASFDLLAYVLRRLQQSSVMVLATWRSDVPASQTLLQMIHDARRSGIFHRISLARLHPEDVIALTNAALPGSGEKGRIAGRLLQETEGLPFFVVEYLELLRQADKQDGEDIWQLPASVRDVLLQRLNGVDDATRQLIGAGAAIGRSFDFSTLREVSGRSEAETITGLEQLTRRGLVVENSSTPEEIIYDFRHDKLRDLVYEETSLARRRLLHRRIAEVLTRPGARIATAAAGVIAQHYHLAGMDEAAADYFYKAGVQAQDVYANAEAARLYRAALAAGYPDQSTLHEAIGDVETLRGEYVIAIASYENAAAVNQEPSKHGLARIEHKLGGVHARMGALDRAESHYRAAYDALVEEEGEVAGPGILADWSYVTYRRGDGQQATELAARALEVAQHHLDQSSQAHAHNMLGILERSQGDHSAALEHLQESLRIANENKLAMLEIAALNNMARLFAEMDRIDEAIDTGQAALARCRQVGDRHREAAILNNLADWLHAHGQQEASLDNLKQAVTIFAEIGNEEGEMQPEIWKLTEW